jgi:hypothetical protein
VFFVSKGRYDDLKVAHKREVDILVSWIEQLQLQVGALGSPRPGAETEKVSDMPGMAMYVSAEEEDLIDAHAQELISDEEFERAMAELGRTQVEIG